MIAESIGLMFHSITGKSVKDMHLRTTRSTTRATFSMWVSILTE